MHDCCFICATLVVILCTWSHVLSASVDDLAEGDAILGLNEEYSRYMQEVSSLLDSDASYQKSVDMAGEMGDFEHHFSQASQETRSKLDELKRIEIRRLKDLHKKSMKLAAEQQRQNLKNGVKPNKKALPKPDLEHIDIHNPDSFGANDLHMLIIKATKSIANIGMKRREQFKQHALREAYNFKSRFRDLPEEEQKKKLEEHLEKAKKHERLNHPGNLKQLKEVWKKYDSMGGVAFNPKTFFMLRDVDGDSLLSPSEIEAMFMFELEKIYGDDADSVARDEDMNRMREHVFTEVDLDQDGMVSLQEFIRSTKDDEFMQDKGWESVQDVPQFTDEELKLFEEAQLKDS
ncbi:nucleobindin-1-like [Watersipora subatra]|uniref:nucleobindin-1-like n=1 Tax=Watersipora subatra TaxID=2589382 RepID=UPI00355B229C